MESKIKTTSGEFLTVEVTPKSDKVDFSKKSLSESQVIAQMQEWLTDCDADTLAEFTGKIFGGKCSFNVETGMYDFVPSHKNYMGAFG